MSNPFQDSVLPAASDDEPFQVKSSQSKIVGVGKWLADVTQIFGRGLVDSVRPSQWKSDKPLRQHGLDDMRAELSYTASGVLEAVVMGRYDIAIGRALAASPDMLHSAIVAHHGDGRQETAQALKESGATDAQDLELSFNEEKLQATREKIAAAGNIGSKSMWSFILASQYVGQTFGDKQNRDLFLRKTFDIKAFPNEAGRTYEATGKLGVALVGLWIGAKDLATNDTAEIVKGSVEFATGIANFVAAGFDWVPEQEKTEEELAEEDQLTLVTLKEETGAWSRNTNKARALVNDFRLMEHYKAAAEAANDNGDAEYDAAVKSYEDISQKYTGVSGKVKLTLAGIANDYVDIKHHFRKVSQAANDNGESLSATVWKDVQKNPNFYAGGLQRLATDLMLPLAAVTANPFFLACYGFHVRGYSAKMHATKRGNSAGMYPE